MNNYRPNDKQLKEDIEKWTSIILKAQKEFKKVNVLINGSYQLIEPSFLLGFNSKDSEIISPLMIDVDNAEKGLTLTLALLSAENIEESHERINLNKMIRWGLWSDEEIIKKMNYKNAYMMGRIKY